MKEPSTAEILNLIMTAACVLIALLGCVFDVMFEILTLLVF